jgi:hypothetical protein
MPKPKAIEPPKPKAWEMTRAELIKAGHEGRVQLNRGGRNVYLMHSPARGDYDSTFWAAHENAVRDALAAGHTVPAHVLADYPHLSHGAPS